MVSLHDLDGLQGGGAGHGVAAEGAADGAGGDGLHNLFPGHDGADGHTSGDGLGGGQNVGLDAGFGPVLGGEHPAGTAEAALHFVGDEEDAVVVADLPQGLHPFNGSGDEAALALEGLHHDGGHGVGGGAFLEDVIDAVDVVLDGLCFGHLSGVAVEIGELCTIHALSQGAHVGGIGLLGGHGHGQQGAAMEGAGEGDDVGTLGVAAGHLDGVLVGLGAGVGEVGTLLVALDGDDGGQLLGQGHIAFVGDDVEHAVEILFRLGFHGLHDLGMGVADVQHAHAADPVQEAVAVHVFQHGALALGDDHGIDAADGVRDHVGAAVDDGLCLGTGQGFGDDLGQVST